jgi:hypothetical protein
MTIQTSAGKLKLDLGCGQNKKEGFIGADIINFDGKVDVVCDLTKTWPWENESVEEAHCSHFIEHLESNDRIHFVNELYRVLIPGGKCTIITPHWASTRAYGDLTHKWPPVCEFWYYYLLSSWRKTNAPHNLDYKCNFSATWGYITLRNLEFQNFALSNYKDVAQDIIATILKEKEVI